MEYDHTDNFLWKQKRVKGNKIDLSKNNLGDMQVIFLLVQTKLVTFIVGKIPGSVPWRFFFLMNKVFVVLTIQIICYIAF